MASFRTVPADVSNTDSVPETVIVGADGIFVMELPGYNWIRGALFTANDGTLSTDTNAKWVKQDGTITPATLTGKLANNRMTGTTTGGDFDVTLTDLQSQSLDMTSKPKVYLSTVNSTGQIAVFKFGTETSGGSTTGTISGNTYATLADAQEIIASGYDPATYKTGKYTGVYQGSWQYTETSAAATTHVNALNVGVGYGVATPSGVTWNDPSVYGLAYFDADGSMVILMANPANKAAQWSGVLIGQ